MANNNSSQKQVVARGGLPWVIRRLGKASATVGSGTTSDPTPGLPLASSPPETMSAPTESAADEHTGLEIVVDRPDTMPTYS